MANPNCPKCRGEGRYKRPDGSIQTCFDCLAGGAMDQHSDKVPESRIKI